VIIIVIITIIIVTITQQQSRTEAPVECTPCHLSLMLKTTSQVPCLPAPC
jgi:hypothetical protein